jgi:hypothetical protein
MQKILPLLSVLSLVLIACSGGGSDGPPGAQGPAGPAGPPGADGLIGTVFEVEVDFLAANDFEALVQIPPEIEVFDTDVVLAYVLVEVDDGVDVWEPLPQLIFFGADTLLTGFNYTFGDVLFFLDGTIDPASLDPSFTTGLVFRVAVVPADFVDALKIGDANAVMRALNVEAVSRIN